MTTVRTTRVLPAVEGLQTERPAMASGRDRQILSVLLHDHAHLELWEDRIVAPDCIYRLDEALGVRLVADPRAPLVVEDPPLGVALLSRSAQWTTYLPYREEDAWHLLFAIRQACQARDIRLADSADQPEQTARGTWAAREPTPTRPAHSLAARMASQPIADKPTAARPPYGPPAPVRSWATQPAPSEPAATRPTQVLAQPIAGRPAPALSAFQVRGSTIPPAPMPISAPPRAPASGPTWIRSDAQWAMTTPRLAVRSGPPSQSLARNGGDPETGFTDSERVLAAITHLSLLFLPVLLPGMVWLALRESTPRVAQHARHAVKFHLVFYLLVLPLLAYTFASALAHRPALAAVAGLLLLLAVGAYSAFTAAAEALHGRPASYFALLRM